MRFSRINSTPFARVVSPDITRPLKDLRKVLNQDAYTSAQTRYITPKEQLDFVAQQVWGENSEYLWYLIADRNIREIIGWNADFKQIRNIEIPIPSEYGV